MFFQQLLFLLILFLPVFEAQAFFLPALVLVLAQDFFPAVLARP